MAEAPIFEKKNVLVTGGAGFIGSFLCERLLKDSKVICIDNFVTSSPTNIEHLLQYPDFEFIRADINEPIELEKYPELERFKVKFQGIQEIYHLACPTSAKHFDKFRHQTVLANSVGMRNVLDLAVKHKAKMFHASTAVIYGPRSADGQLMREDDLGCVDHLTPRACYDEGKRWAETCCRTYQDVFGIDVRIGRIFRTYGPRMPIFDGQLVSDFIVSAIDNQELVIYGDESFRTSFCYVSDMVDAIMRLMSLPQDPGPINIGSDFDIPIVDVAKRIIEIVGSTSQIKFEPPLLFLTRLGLPDLTKAKDKLGWIPLVSLEQGLKKTIEYTVASKGRIKSPFGG